MHAVVDLDEQNFEHLTQAATGATSGDWLVLFCKESVSRCTKVVQNWQRVAVTLAASREAKGLPRINVAQVDTSQSSWLRKRFGIQPEEHLEQQLTGQIIAHLDDLFTCDARERETEERGRATHRTDSHLVIIHTLAHQVAR